ASPICLRGIPFGWSRVEPSPRGDTHTGAQASRASPQPLAGPSLPFPGGERRLTAPDRRRRPRPGRPPPPDRRASSAPGRPGRPGPRKGETVELAEGEQAALRLGQPAEHVADRDRVAREFRHSELLRV